MRKCPRCGYEVSRDEKFCPHCGLDIQQHDGPRGPKNKAMTYLLYVIIFFSFITIPLFYSRILGGMDNSLSSTPNNKEKVELKEVKDVAPTSIVANYTTLADYNNQFTNVSSYVKGIEKYEADLATKGDYTFDKEYIIQVLDNNNVLYGLKYSVKINDQMSLVIERQFDRAHSYNKEIVNIKKNDVGEFKDFMFNEDELETAYSFIDNQDLMNKLMNEFSTREDEFSKKKEKLGHYGLGNYEGESSFVAYRNEKTYYSLMTYSHEPKEYID